MHGLGIAYWPKLYLIMLVRAVLRLFQHSKSFSFYKLRQNTRPVKVKVKPRFLAPSAGFTEVAKR